VTQVRRFLLCDIGPQRPSRYRDLEIDPRFSARVHAFAVSPGVTVMMLFFLGMGGRRAHGPRVIC